MEPKHKVNAIVYIFHLWQYNFMLKNAEIFHYKIHCSNWILLSCAVKRGHIANFKFFIVIGIDSLKNWLTRKLNLNFIEKFIILIFFTTFFKLEQNRWVSHFAKWNSWISFFILGLLTSILSRKFKIQNSIIVFQQQENYF
jgi:hypothetical protein